MLLGGCAAVFTLRALPLVAVVLASTCVVLWLFRGQYTRAGHFGLANAITLLRLAITLSLGLLPNRAAGVALLALLALDGLDGFVARRLDLSSPFGAHFDMETDALLVAFSSLELLLRGLVGPWVLSAGALRYAYVICLWVFPARRGDAPRSRWGRFTFAGLVLGLAAPFLLGRDLGAPLAALGCCAVLVSFGRSFWYSYTHSSSASKRSNARTNC